LQKSSSSLILKTLKRFWLGSSRARILKNLWSGFVWDPASLWGSLQGSWLVWFHEPLSN
jgi:hypothetical protein